jgi:glutathione gamma-glutamylcysteinyltransferase
MGGSIRIEIGRIVQWFNHSTTKQAAYRRFSPPGRCVSVARATMEQTLYRRPLPAESIAFSSPEGRRIFGEALAAGEMDGYFPLAEQFHTQSDPSFCGLGSLVVALNALAIDPGRLWKGPWRWFAEDLLDCCVPLAEVKQRGLDLDELACLARCNGADVDLERADAADVAAWRQALTASARGESVVIAAYDRAAMGQTGSGHFSPVGGYHAHRDLALVLDVARFKYPPHWVPATRLFEAMHSIDAVTGRARGWMTLRRRAHGIALGFSLKCEGDSWPGLSRRLTAVAAELGHAADLASLSRAVAPLASHVEVRTPHAPAHEEAWGRARAALRSLPAYPVVEQAVGAERAEVVTILLLAMSDRLTAAQRHELDGSGTRSAIDEDTPLGAELSNLRAQLTAVWEHAADR